MSDEELRRSSEILNKAKQILLGDDIPKDFHSFFEKLNVTSDDYHRALSFSKHGRTINLKRNFNELFVNNYNPDWLEAWDANLDLQFCCDTYAVVTYICDYYSKGETGMTDLLKATIKARDESRGREDLLKQMKAVYLSHRQVSSCEATYRLLPQLHMKDSKITSIFVATGFPENRCKLLKYIENVNVNVENENIVAVSGHQGRYIFTKSIHERYSKRPDYLNDFCLAEFAICYQPIWKDTTRHKEKVIYLKDNFGQMKRRKVRCVIRIHDSYRKTEEHEFYYSECLLYYPWRDETIELHRDYTREQT